MLLDDASQSLNRIATIPEGDGPLFVMDNTVEANYSFGKPFAQAALAVAFSTVQSLGYKVIYKLHKKLAIRILFLFN